MPIEFTGDKFSSTNRVLTLCHSLDYALGDALGNVGVPLGSAWEVYGAKGTGKTTFATSLMGIIASKTHKNITLLDWEGQSRETIEGILTSQKFYGKVEYMLNLTQQMQSFWILSLKIATLPKICASIVHTPNVHPLMGKSLWKIMWKPMAKCTQTFTRSGQKQAELHVVLPTYKTNPTRLHIENALLPMKENA